MKYEAELLAEIIANRGHQKSSIHYESECKEAFIDEAKGAYPKLCDYESEWLNYMVENPIGEFPYETITDVTEATINNVVPFAFKSVILSGNTLVNHCPESIYTENGWGTGVYKQFDNFPTLVKGKTYTFYAPIGNKEGNAEDSVVGLKITTDDTKQTLYNSLSNGHGTIFKTFTMGDRLWFENYEITGTRFQQNYPTVMILDGEWTQESMPEYFKGIASCKMPVLKSVGKNLFDMNAIVKDDFELGKYRPLYYGKEFVLQPNTTYTIKPYLQEEITSTSVWTVFNIIYKDRVSEVININKTGTNDKNTMKTVTFTTDSTGKVGYSIYSESNSEVSWLGNLPFNIQLEEGSTATPYEPYKSNILTVNEPIELRGIGEVQDALDCLTGEVVKHVGEVVLDGTNTPNIKFLEPNRAEGYTVFPMQISDVFPHIIANYNNATQLISNNFNYLIGGYGNSLAGKWMCINAMYFVLSISNDELESLDIQGLNKWLSLNKTTIYYPSEKSIKTVDLSVVNQDGQSVSRLKPIEGTMHMETDGQPLKPLLSAEIPVEAITQNLASFINEE